jgi:iron(III) transport system ATP-binding protein
MISAHALELAHGDKSVVRDFSFQLQPGQILCLMGPSGCGKTTLLRALAGLHPLKAGRIERHSRVVATDTLRARPETLKLGFVFQDLALFPHLTVADNIGLGLTGVTRTQRTQKISEMLQRFELSGFAERYPHELSGGQQQRVAIARALAPDYDLVLLDEPFSSLDAQLRLDLSRLLRSELKRRGAAAIMVSHDQEEGLVCADVIAVMHDGMLMQWGTPLQIYHQPAHEFVARFIGESAWLPLQRERDHWRCALGEFPAHDAIVHAKLLLRPEALSLSDDAANAVAGIIVHGEFRGSHTRYRIRIRSLERDEVVLLNAAHSTPLPDGSHVHLRLSEAAPTIFASSA